MLISRMPEDGGHEEDHVRVAARRGDATGDNSHEYRTASELFDLMAKTQNFQPTDDETLTTRDLVLLYKNIDLGTKLMSTANEFKRNTPNQYVETIVYEDFESDSDISEIYSNDDIHNVVMINKEQIDLLNNPPSIENTLCQKFGEVGIHCSNISINYDRKIIFKDTFVKEKLKNLSLVSNTSDGKALPTSLLDYICCKRLEDNYNIHMDSIITHVKHTIDQLTRISNGDYLTDKAKEKWREVDKGAKIENSDNTKILANTTSIPLYVERKASGRLTKWDDLVHSSVDVRSLSKILEKKITIEVPKTIGSFRLFTKCCDDNLQICCKKEKPLLIRHGSKSRVNVILQLNRSDSGHIVSNINSIMILQTTCNNDTGNLADVLPLPYKDVEVVDDDSVVKEIAMAKPFKSRIVELFDTEQQPDETKERCEKECEATDDNFERPQEDSTNCTTLVTPEDLGPIEYSYEHNDSFDENSEPLAAPNDDSILKRLSSLPEESCDDNLSFNTKKKLQMQQRIKSPYENKSYYIEEKKRKKLLEIRQRREKKKLAWTESCKINKHKYTKGIMSPQTVSSVTKLSITNKSFYNSIYGHTAHETIEKKSKIRGRREKRQVIRLPTDKFEVNDEIKTRDQYINIRKYVNKSYYLDDAVTEMMYIKMKKEKCSQPTGKLIEQTASPLKNDFKVNWKMLSRVTSPTDDSEPVEAQSENLDALDDKNQEPYSGDGFALSCTPKPSVSKTRYDAEEETAKGNTSIEFRKDIDKIYKLMKKLGKSDRTETKVKSKFTTITETHKTARENSIILNTDSGTSMKHHNISSSPSSFSFEKMSSQDEEPVMGTLVNKRHGRSKTNNVVPKVIINTKYHSHKDDKNKGRNSPTKLSENPLKAISHLLQEFNNVQKIRNKSLGDQKVKKPDADAKPDARQAARKNVRLENQLKETGLPIDRYRRTRERKAKSPTTFKTNSPIEHSKNPHQPNVPEDKTGKAFRKKVVDIVDELKEARGEAVRGPPRNSSRLNSLAQPKRSYIQAQIEDFQSRYGRSVVTDRLQKLTGAATANTAPVNDRSKQKRRTSVEPMHKPMAPPVLERNLKKPLGNKCDIVVPSTIPVTEQSYKPGFDTRDNLKKKMVAVESYVKHHYGAAPWTVDPSERHVHKARAPLIPKDIQLISPSMSSSSMGDGSLIVDGKTHRIIKTMINKTPISPIDEIEITDLKKNINNSRLNLKDHNYQFSNSHDPQILSIKQESIIGDTILEECDPPPSEVALSAIGKTTSENGLCEKLSSGTFNKLLRFKNSKHTPKESLHQVLFLQSGDANSSLFIKSTLSHSLLTVSNDSTEKISKSHLDWTLTKFPMQIATVGYSFPQYDYVTYDKRNGPEKKCACTSPLCDKTEKCDEESCHFLERGAQIDANEFVAVSNDSNIGSSAIIEEPDEDKDISANNEMEKIPVDDIENPATIKPTNYENVEGTNVSNSILDKKDELSDSKHSILNGITSEITVSKNIIIGENLIIKGQESDIDYTTSLDILVGLLNEIQKITTCQTQMTSTADNIIDSKDFTVIKSAIALESVQKEARNIISISSLDRLRHLDSKSSVYSMYLSEDKELDKKTDDLNPIHADKEVYAFIPERELLNKCTEVPSRCLPVTVSHATSVSNSLIGILSEPSSQSIYAFNNPLHDNKSLTSIKKIIKLSENEINENQQDIKERAQKKTNKKTQDKGAKKMDDQLQKKKNGKTNKTHVSVIDEDNKKLIRSINNKNKSNIYGVHNDPLMKMKRDILVTVYSFLVLTVFAALSFPEIMGQS